MKLIDTGLPAQLAREILPTPIKREMLERLTQRMEFEWSKGKIPTTKATVIYSRVNIHNGVPFEEKIPLRHITLGDAAIWALDNGFPVRPEILNALGLDSNQTPPESPSPGNGAKWPWGDHETELLRHLAAAAERFWKNYDPTDKGTAPTNDQVSEWLVSRDVPPYLSKAIATILRPKDVPTGPRK